MKSLALPAIFAFACISASALTLEKEVPESDSGSSPPAGPAACGGCAGSQPSGAAAPKTLLLTGEAEHSETLPPVPQSLLPGRVFNLSAAQQGFPTNEDWMLIPQWLAGNWHSDVEYAIENGRPVGYVTRSTRSFGSLIDRFGNIWQYKHLPWNETVDDGNSLDSKLVISEKRLGQEPNRYVDKAVTIDVIYDRNTGTILNTYQQEELQWIYPQPDHTLRVNESIKRYDSNGNPGVTRQGYFIRQPVGPFAMRWDLLDSFRNYLAGHDLQASIPDVPQTASSTMP